MIDDLRHAGGGSAEQRSLIVRQKLPKTLTFVERKAATVRHWPYNTPKTLITALEKGAPTR
ncbi:hypothetical protein [Mycetohabitans endofungorum]|uniref:hypothetical protein n=1 Tax=Mycetohabitans endofungorum TaxID=417203 RepID=UPI0011B099E5|nr:hypothetical protein [Mycetohabitans endofungorum]